MDFDIKRMDTSRRLRTERGYRPSDTRAPSLDSPVVYRDSPPDFSTYEDVTFYKQLSFSGKNLFTRLSHTSIDTISGEISELERMADSFGIKLCNTRDMLAFSKNYFDLVDECIKYGGIVKHVYSKVSDKKLANFIKKLPNMRERADNLFKQLRKRLGK